MGLLGMTDHNSSSTIDASPTGPGDAGRVATSLGSVLSALAASSCCIVPLVLFSLGAGGAWIGNFTALAPYQPIFVVLTLGFLGAGFWMVHSRPQGTLPEGSYCPGSVARPWFKIALWSSTVLILSATLFLYAAPLILDV